MILWLTKTIQRVRFWFWMKLRKERSGQAWDKLQMHYKRFIPFLLTKLSWIWYCSCPWDKCLSVHRIQIICRFVWSMRQEDWCLTNHWKRSLQFIGRDLFNVSSQDRHGEVLELPEQTVWRVTCAILAPHNKPHSVKSSKELVLRQREYLVGIHKGFFSIRME